MKLEQKKIDGDGKGFLKLLPEVDEDMWHVYNLLVPGDHLTAICFRKVTKESNTGSVSATRVRIKLTLAVHSVEFDRSSCQIRVKGKNLTENDLIKIGQFHTMELDLNRPFSIEKTCWDALYLERVAEACDVSRIADVAALVMQPGMAHLCLITSHMTQVRAKIELNIPRKRLASSSGHDKALIRFFEAMGEAIVKHIDFAIVKCLIVASPGFLKDDFLKWLLTEATKRDWTKVIEHKSKLLPCHSSSGFKHSLKEVMADSTVAAKINNTKAFGEVKALDQFFETMQQDPERAYYGLGHVQRATALKAVDTLLLSDSLFRSEDHKVRQSYVDLCADVREHGGDVKIFSALHVSGEQLAQISGVAALLRFPLPDLDDEDEAATTTTVLVTSASKALAGSTDAKSGAASVTIGSAGATAPATKSGGGDFKRSDASQKQYLSNLRDADYKGGASGAPTKSAGGVSAASAAEAIRRKTAHHSSASERKTVKSTGSSGSGSGSGSVSIGGGRKGAAAADDDLEADADAAADAEADAEAEAADGDGGDGGDDGDNIIGDDPGDGGEGDDEDPDDNPPDGDYSFDADAASTTTTATASATTATAAPAASSAASGGAKSTAADAKAPTKGRGK